MWGIVLCIFATTSGIIVFDEVLEDGGKEVIVLLKGFFKREVDQFINECSSKGCSMGCVCHEVGQSLKERDLRIVCGLSREDGSIFLGNISHRIVEDGIEVSLALLIPEVRDKMVRLKDRYIWTQ